MTLEEFTDAVMQARIANREWRYGQTVFNMLHKHRPELAEQVRGTGLDPFHADNPSVRFWIWLLDAWGSPVTLEGLKKIRSADGATFPQQLRDEMLEGSPADSLQNRQASESDSGPGSGLLWLNCETPTCRVGTFLVREPNPEEDVFNERNCPSCGRPGIDGVLT